jgi:hypothetical protein
VTAAAVKADPTSSGWWFFVYLIVPGAPLLLYKLFERYTDPDVTRQMLGHTYVI